jgi:hypothetical protein
MCAWQAHAALIVLRRGYATPQQNQFFCERAKLSHTLTVRSISVRKRIDYSRIRRYAQARSLSTPEEELMSEHSDADRTDERPGERQDDGQRTGDTGLTGWLRRAISPRPREVWVMEPDGKMRKVEPSDG